MDRLSVHLNISALCHAHGSALGSLRLIRSDAKGKLLLVIKFLSVHFLSLKVRRWGPRRIMVAQLLS